MRRSKKDKGLKQEVRVPLYVIIIVVLVIILINPVKNYIDDLKYKNSYDEEFDEIEYTVPKEFDDYVADNYFSYYGEKFSCNINITASEKRYISDFEKWFKRQINVDLNDKVGDIKEIEVDSKKAYNVEVESNNRIIHYYGLESTNYFYEVRYTLYDDNHGEKENPCAAYEGEFIASIKLK